MRRFVSIFQPYESHFLYANEPEPLHSVPVLVKLKTGKNLAGHKPKVIYGVIFLPIYPWYDTGNKV